MRITVKTGAADKIAQEITDELLTTIDAQRERGRSYLYGQADAYLNTLAMPLKTMAETGQLAEIHDLAHGEAYRGKVTSISISVVGARIDQRIDVERPV